MADDAFVTLNDSPPPETRATRSMAQSRRVSAVHLLVIIGLALALRVACVYATRDVPTARHLIGDAAGYVAWAQRIAGGDWVGKEGFYQAPLYPYVLAACMTVVGSDLGTLRVVQAVWGAMACACLYLGASRLLGRREGFVSGLLLAMYPPAIYYDGIIQKTSLTGLLTCGVILAVAGATARPGTWKLAAAGIPVAVLSITRENALVWAAVLAVWAWHTGRHGSWFTGHSTRTPDPSPLRHRPGALAMGAFLAGVALVLGPVAVRNRAVSGEWSLSTFQAGPNFYIGNHRGADGRYQPLVRGHETPEFERKDATSLAQQALDRPLSAREVSRYWMDRAWKDILAEPMRWLRLLGYKLLLVVNRYEIADAESYDVYRDASVLLRLLGQFWHFGVLLPLAVVGVGATWPRRAHLWPIHAMLITMSLAVAAFYVLGRYRFPLVPLLMVFAAGGLIATWEAAAGRAWAKLTRGSVLAAVVAAVANLPVQDERRLNALARMNAGVALAQGGEIEPAIDWFRRAVADHPQSAEGHNNLAQALAVKRRFADAIPHYETALALAPDLRGADFNLAVALENLGRKKDALRHYEQAMTLDPNDAEARAAVKRLRVIRE